MEVPETVFTQVFYAASQALQATLGEPQPPWDELPAWQHQAMVDVTRSCMMGANPKQLHTLWVQHYSAQGWTYGPEKNWETRQHPIIILWHELPLRYQARFKLWQAMVATLMLEIPEYPAPQASRPCLKTFRRARRSPQTAPRRPHTQNVRPKREHKCRSNVKTFSAPRQDSNPRPAA